MTIASHYKLMDSPTVTAGWPMLNVVDKIMDIDGNQLPLMSLVKSMLEVQVLPGVILIIKNRLMKYFPQ